MSWKYNINIILALEVTSSWPVLSIIEQVDATNKHRMNRSEGWNDLWKTALDDT